jgi:hypothetical protein
MATPRHTIRVDPAVWAEMAAAAESIGCPDRTAYLIEIHRRHVAGDGALRRENVRLRRALLDIAEHLTAALRSART